MNLLHRRRNSSPAAERGQTLSEYSVLVGLIAIVVAVALPLVGTSITRLFSSLASALGS